MLLVDPCLGAKGPLPEELRLQRIKSMSCESPVEVADVGVSVLALACNLLNSAAKQRVIVFSKVRLSSPKRRPFKARLRIGKMILSLIMLSVSANLHAFPMMHSLFKNDSND